MLRVVCGRWTLVFILWIFYIHCQLSDSTSCYFALQFNTPAQAPQGHEAEGMQNNTGAQIQAGLQAQPGQALPSLSLPQVLQMPLGAALTVPSLNAVE